MAAVLTFKLAIERASAANFNAAITQQMVADALYGFNDVPSFWGPLNFLPSGSIADSTGKDKPMYSTQIQLTTTGEIPVVLPRSAASLNTKAPNAGTKFEFEYPSLKYRAQKA